MVKQTFKTVKTWESINGVMKLVEYVRYSSGVRIKRYLNPITEIPEEIIRLNATQSDIALRISDIENPATLGSL